MLESAEEQKILKMLAQQQITQAEAKMLLKSARPPSLSRKKLKPLPMGLKIWFGVMLVIITGVFFIVFSSSKGEHLREQLAFLGLFQSETVERSRPPFDLKLGSPHKFAALNNLSQPAKNWGEVALKNKDLLVALLYQHKALKALYHPRSIVLEVVLTSSEEKFNFKITDEGNRKLLTLTWAQMADNMKMFAAFFEANNLSSVKIPYEVMYP